MPGFHIGPHEQRLTVTESVGGFLVEMASPGKGVVQKAITYTEAAELADLFIGGRLADIIGEATATMREAVTEMREARKLIEGRQS